MFCSQIFGNWPTHARGAPYHTLSPRVILYLQVVGQNSSNNVLWMKGKERPWIFLYVYSFSMLKPQYSSSRYRHITVYLIFLLVLTICTYKQGETFLSPMEHKILNKGHVFFAVFSNEFFLFLSVSFSHRVHTTAAFWRTFHHEGKISPGW